MRLCAVVVLAALAAGSCSAPSGTTSLVVDDVVPSTTAPAVTSTDPAIVTTVVPTSTSSTTPPSTTTTSTLDLETAGTRMQSDLATVVGYGVREAGSREEADAAAFIFDALARMGLPVEMREVPLPTGSSSSNVMASIGDGQTHVLLGGHYDSKPPSPGADDNGSGTVVLLEVARRLAVSVPDELRVTVVFFGAEETLVGYSRDNHHFGSRLLAEEMAAAGDLPDLMLSADMIGVGPSILAATYLDSDSAAAELVVDAASRIGVQVDMQSRGDISDHEAFARWGVPSVMLWRPDNPDYHQPTDLAVRTDALLEDLAIIESFLDLLTADH